MLSGIGLLEGYAVRCTGCRSLMPNVLSGIIQIQYGFMHRISPVKEVFSGEKRLGCL